MAGVLVIGVGSDLRRDDAAGRHVAEEIEALSLGGVAVHVVTQLVPELVETISAADRVVFVDASIEVAKTTLSPVTAGAVDQSAWTHHTTPQSLLAMTGTVGTIPASAHTVSIPVADLGLGMELSPISAAGVDEAVCLITDLICE